jgi:hypothetical protein
MPLWRILLKAQAQPEAPLTCDECIAVLDYLADQAIRGVNLDSLRQAVHKHLSRCPDCRAEYLKWLRELEAW